MSDQECAELGEQEQEIDRVVRKAAPALTADELKLLQWATGTAPTPRRPLVNLANDLAL